MEIRANPYEELEGVGGGHADNTLEMADIPFNDIDLGTLSKKKPGDNGGPDQNLQLAGQG